MPKTQQFESVLHDWVHLLPFQQQALLLTAMRGPDGLPKHNIAKAIIRFLRGVVIKPAGDWRGENNNDFMWGNYKETDKHMSFQWHVSEFWNDPDQYPLHFVLHLLHASEVVAYKHPDEKIKREWYIFYLTGVESLHLNPEFSKEMDKRLGDFGHGWHNVGDNGKAYPPFWDGKLTIKLTERGDDGDL
jgi:hypothetical protein